uniref:Uncharacterized protein n=1 Tax=Siphoviridae sp. ctss15 TaxID=2825699 RepID=A0A8S5TRB6_9CAUD|nr:MAG TPA: hypothetical protein [Siphoviridae sp. ctss15]DAP94755.1 MAG TPA: hypothetical protein [Caudoviricetes sp.]
MERLTKRGTDGQAMMDCEKCKADWTGKHGKPMADCTALYCRNRLKDRLAAYEDRECAPEEVLPKDKADEIALKLMRLADLESLCSYTRLRELAEADKDGRLVVLPCKVGDTVYRLFAGNPDNPVIATLKINTVAEAVKLIGKMGMHKYIGTFLTREEAEKALEAMK